MKLFFYMVLQSLSGLFVFYKQGHQLIQMAPNNTLLGRRLTAQYLRSQNTVCFGRSGTQNDDAKNLVNTFQGWMSDTVIAFHGTEWKSTGRRSSILVCAERENYSAAHTDCYENSNRWFLLAIGGMSNLLIPPAGDAEEERSE